MVIGGIPGHAKKRIEEIKEKGGMKGLLDRYIRLRDEYVKVWALIKAKKEVDTRLLSELIILIDRLNKDISLWIKYVERPHELKKVHKDLTSEMIMLSEWMKQQKKHHR